MRVITKKVLDLMSEKEDLLGEDQAYHLSHLQHAPEMTLVLQDVKRALASGAGVMPGSIFRDNYFLLDQTASIRAIFKPFAVSGYGDAYRECFASRFDQDHFFHVPPTTLTTLTSHALGGERTGSCQLYIPSSQTYFCWKDREHLNWDQMRRLALLDLLLVNTDRHEGNIVVLDHFSYPIDHSAILPAEERASSLFWVGCKHYRYPISDEAARYVREIDVSRHMAIMREEYKLEDAAIHHYLVAHSLVLAGIELGWTLSDLGSLYLLQKEKRVAEFYEIARKAMGCADMKETVLNELKKRKGCV